MPHQKNFKIQGAFDVFWCDFGISELKVQLTSAHTQTLLVLVAAAQKEHAPSLEPDLPRRKCKYAMGVYILAYGRRRVCSFKRPLIQGGAAPVIQVLGGL